LPSYVPLSETTAYKSAVASCKSYVSHLSVNQLEI